MCVKRWSELFADACVPKEKLPAFFKVNTVFGDYRTVNFSADIAMLPQMEPGRGASLSSLVLASLLDAETANVDDWRQLMQEIRGLLDGLEHESFCFKFRPQSLSVDAFFVTRNQPDMHVFGDRQKLPRPSYWNSRTLTVGLIVRELNVAAFDVDALHAECMRFNAMFEHLDDDTRTGFGYMINVLVVGVTGCSDELRELFGHDNTMAPPEDCEFVSDIVLLDLTTSQKRAEFFGFVGSDEDDKLLISTVDKVVDRAVLRG
jgi:hypothetical protein